MNRLVEYKNIMPVNDCLRRHKKLRVSIAAIHKHRKTVTTECLIIMVRSKQECGNVANAFCSVLWQGVYRALVNQPPVDSFIRKSSHDKRQRCANL